MNAVDVAILTKYYPTPESRAIEDRVRSGMCKLAQADELTAEMFGANIGSLDSATSPPPQLTLPRLLFTTLATKDEQVAGGDRYTVTVYIVYQFEDPQRNFAAPDEPGFATLRAHHRDLYMRRGNIHLNVNIPGLGTTQLIQTTAPGDISHVFETDTHNRSILTIKWAWRFTLTRDAVD